VFADAPTAQQVRDVAEEVFRRAEFQRRKSLLERVIDWIARLFRGREVDMPQVQPRSGSSALGHLLLYLLLAAAVVVAPARAAILQLSLEGRPIAVAVADFGFMGASMGSVFGEKLTRAVERSTQTGAPLLSVNASGGARMHEGLFSLMQMAKTVAAFARLGEARVPHLSLLVDPCYGGVTASYATVADIIMAEPGALIGFAGPRVIEQITKQKLPDGFQTAEFFLDHGMIDLIVDRASLRRRLADLLDHYAQARQVDRGESIPWMPNLSTNGHGANGNATVGDPQNGAAQ